MKIQIALLALAFIAPSLSEARSLKPKQTCAFGESSYDLKEMLDSDAKGKIWYKGEHLSVHKQRLGGLSSSEKKMILLANHYDEITDEQALLDFASSDGYITYFSHNDNEREFAIVASFPGDNEFGVIYEIKQLKRRAEFKVLTQVAIISDGDLEDCKVFNE